MHSFPRSSTTSSSAHARARPSTDRFARTRLDPSRASTPDSTRRSSFSRRTRHPHIHARRHHHHHARQPQRPGDDRQRVRARDGACDDRPRDASARPRPTDRPNERPRDRRRSSTRDDRRPRDRGGGRTDDDREDRGLIWNPSLLLAGARARREREGGTTDGCASEMGGDARRLDRSIGRGGTARGTSDVWSGVGRRSRARRRIGRTTD